MGAWSASTYIHFSDYQRMLHYPLSYHSKANDTFYSSVDFMGITVYISGYNSDTVDAWGTIKLPSGVYTNALRVHQTAILKDSVNIGSPSVNISQTETYSWYVAGFHSPIFTITYDTMGSSTPYVSGVRYFTKKPGTLGVNNTTLQTSALQVYPNPATSNVNFRFALTGTEAASLIITDMTGRTVANVNATEMKAGINVINLATSQLPSGMYIAHLHSVDGNNSAKFTIAK